MARKAPTLASDQAAGTGRVGAPQCLPEGDQGCGLARADPHPHHLTGASAHRHDLVSSISRFPKRATASSKEYWLRST